MGLDIRVGEKYRDYVAEPANTLRLVTFYNNCTQTLHFSQGKIGKFEGEICIHKQMYIVTCR